MEDLLDKLREFEKLLNEHAISKGDKPQNIQEFFSQDTRTIEAQLFKWFH